MNEFDKFRKKSSKSNGSGYKKKVNRQEGLLFQKTELFAFAYFLQL